MKIIVRLTLVMLIASASQCEKPFLVEDYVFHVKNESAKPISFLVSQTYPDTSISLELLNNKLFTVLPGALVPWSQEDPWKDFFSNLPSDTLSIFFFNRDTLDHYSAHQISSKYKILERRDITLKYLENQDYQIVYP